MADFKVDGRLNADLFGWLCELVGRGVIQSSMIKATLYKSEVERWLKHG